MQSHKELPNNREAETALLSAIMGRPEKIHTVMPILRGAEDFYSPRNQEIYRAMVTLATSEQQADYISVLGELNRTKKNTQWCEILSQISDVQTPGVPPEYYAKMIAKAANRRKLIEIAHTMIQDAYEESDDNALFDQAEKEILSIRHGGTAKPLRHMRECVAATSKALEDVWSGHTQIGRSTGLHTLDWLIRLMPAKVYIIAARPGVGKSSFVAHILKNLGFDGEPSALFSLEMDEIELTLRFLSSLSGISGEQLTSRLIGDQRMMDLSIGVSKAIKLPIYIDDSPSLTVTAIKAKCRQLLLEVPHIGAIVVDYIQLVDNSAKSNSRERDVAEVSRALKVMSKEFHCPVLALSQLNREVEKRGDGRPRLSDLRESGAIEADADQVIFLHRDRKDSGEMSEFCEVIVAKNRGGRTGSVVLKMRPDTYDFETLPDPQDPYGQSHK